MTTVQVVLIGGCMVILNYECRTLGLLHTVWAGSHKHGCYLISGIRLLAMGKLSDITCRPSAQLFQIKRFLKYILFTPSANSHQDNSNLV